MYAATDFKDGKLGIYDSSDGVTEWYTPKQVKSMIKSYGLEIYGVTLDEKCNPMFTLDGLRVNLMYRYSHKTTVIGRFMFVILTSSDFWGSSFSEEIKKPTVAIFDLGASNHPKSEYPSGQYITSYYAETLLKHEDGYGLQFDTSVDLWKISARDMKELKMFLEYQLKL